MVLKVSIENISNAYDTTEDPKKLDFLINSDDILIKIINYIEFWREKNVTAQNLIYNLNLLSSFFKHVSDEQLFEIQV